MQVTPLEPAKTEPFFNFFLLFEKKNISRVKKIHFLIDHDLGNSGLKPTCHKTEWMDLK